MQSAGYSGVRLLDVNRTNVEEQRSTEWMRFESLPEALDPANPGLTIEGYPAPARALFHATVQSVPMTAAASECPSVS